MPVRASLRDPRGPTAPKPACAIAQALGVVGDWWTLLVVRELAGGVTRFGELADTLGVSRKVLTERLNALVEHGLVRRSRYSDHPPAPTIC
ncbi:MAG: winged helix-turn-helix transcriptional regulator [Solirubrobacteraceae bacterium]